MRGNAPEELSVDDYEMEDRCTESKDGGIAGRLGRWPMRWWVFRAVFVFEMYGMVLLQIVGQA